MAGVVIGTVDCFADAKCDKEQAVKVLEEAAEVFAEWQKEDEGDPSRIASECADLIQAVCNLLHACGVDDMRPVMAMCRLSNEMRGRFYEVQEQCDEVQGEAQQG